MNPKTSVGIVCAMVAVCLLPVDARAQSSLGGVVLDALGARLAGATVTLVGEQQQAGETTAAADGTYTFTGIAPGRYQVVARAAGFETFTSDAVYVAAGARVTVDVTLQLGPIAQALIVTASTVRLYQSQTGAPVTVIDTRTIDALNKPDLLEALRLVPGAQVHQTGARGGTTSMFVRGGSSNFTKVLVDGISVNDIGGGFDFSQIQTTGVERIEVMRQSNSALHGSDALAGVINITTKRGRTRVPEASYSIDGGNLGTFRNVLSLGGAVRRFDYFSEYSYFRTDNDLPNNTYRNGTYAGRFGLALGSGTDLSGTIRRIDGEYGTPNAVPLYGIPDDSSSKAGFTYGGLTAESQWTDHWQTTVRYGWTDQTSRYLNPAPTGLPFDPFGFGANYLGNVVTVRGANGHTATGRAILDYGGAYPQTYDVRSTRSAVFGQTTYHVGPGFDLSGGARFEREQGYSDPDGEADITRDNGGVFVDGRGSVGGRAYISAGLGYEHNAVFKSAVTPRLSVALYARESVIGAVGDTKITFNVGKGIKAPAVYQEQSSLYTLLQSVPAASRPTVDPIGPERSRTLDVGVEQGLAGGQARVRVSYFRNTFEDLIEYVARSVLPQVGVPVAAAQATPFGAYVNSSSFRAQGLETSAEAVVRAMRFSGSYTYLDAVVTKSFSGDALFPAINPSIPGIQIGQYGPLVGARPFRRPAHSGSLMASYTRGPADVALSAYVSGKRDGSTFLSDPFFGASMLLPNRDLEAGFQKWDLAGAYRAHRRLRAFVSIENLFDDEYEASFGFPALSATVRAGVTLSVGGL
jgi:iron complex outermembrane receptor protein/vitamin B12 transporter